MKTRICWWLVFLAASIVLWGVLKPVAYDLAKPNKGIVPDKNSERVSLILERLIACESGGREDAIAINDGGTGLDSRGVLQFQFPTFKRFAQAFNLFPYADAADLENLWPDKESQIKVATAMLLTDKRNLKHWTCAQKVNAVL